MGHPFSIALILLPGFSLLTLGAVRAVFAVANEVEGEALYRLRQFSPEGEAALSQCGLTQTTDALATLYPEPAGLLLLIGSEHVEAELADAGAHELGQQLQRFGHDRGWLLGASAGVALPIRFGLSISNPAGSGSFTIRRASPRPKGVISSTTELGSSTSRGLPFQ